MGKRTGDAITIVIADDHRSFGEALEVALDTEADLKVIEVVTDGSAAIETAHQKHPDVVLMDLSMPGINGIEAARKIHEDNEGTVVIVLSGREDDDVALARAIQAGARGFMAKTEAVTGLADAIRRAHRGEPLHASEDVDRAMQALKKRRAADGDLAQRIERLTPRELEILQRMANGDAPEQIAEDLGMSRHTLRTHTQNVLTKLGVHSKLEAIVAAIRYGKVSTVGIAAEDEDDEIDRDHDGDPEPVGNHA